MTVSRGMRAGNRVCSPNTCLKWTEKIGIPMEIGDKVLKMLYQLQISSPLFILHSPRSNWYCLALLRLYNAHKRKENEHDNQRQSWKIRFTTINKEYFRSFRMKITNVMINVLRLTELVLKKSVCDLKLCFNGFFTFVFYSSYSVMLSLQRFSILFSFQNWSRVQFV